MGQGNPYARMLKIMERKGAAENGYDMVVAKIVSVKPLSISVNGQIIKEHIICNSLIPSDKDEELKAILDKEKNISKELKQFLTDLYKELRVKQGETILVQRVNNSFYVCGKVGKSE